MDTSFAPTQLEMDEHPPLAVPDSAPSRLHTWLQRLGIGGPSRLHDAQTGLFNRRGLLTRGERLLARNGAADAALVVFDFSDLLEVRCIYGSRAGAAARRAVVSTLARLAGRRGIAARTGPAQFAVLLPGACVQRALDAVHRVLGQPCRLELELGREELVLVPHHAIGACEREPDGLEQQYMQLSVAIAQERAAEERRRRRARARAAGQPPTTSGAPLAPQPAALPAA